jgi:hypothetical protein
MVEIKFTDFTAMCAYQFLLQNEVKDWNAMHWSKKYWLKQTII